LVVVTGGRGLSWDLLADGYLSGSEDVRTSLLDQSMDFFSIN
jgi:hypothetical protein